MIRYIKRRRLGDFISLSITYLAVKLVYWLAGFDYDIFSEGIFNTKLLIDILSWVGIYALVFILLKTFIPKAKNLF